MAVSVYRFYTTACVFLSSIFLIFFAVDSVKAAPLAVLLTLYWLQLKIAAKGSAFLDYYL